MICWSDFEETDMVTPLPCDIRHYFHTECIENWLQTKNNCPLCKTDVTLQTIKSTSENFSKEIQKQIELRSPQVAMRPSPQVVQSNSSSAFDQGSRT